MRCSKCRQCDAINTWRDKLASWLVWHIFPETLKDEKQASNLQGFTDGYSMGTGHQRSKTEFLEGAIRTIKEEVAKAINPDRNYPYVA